MDVGYTWSLVVLCAVSVNTLQFVQLLKTKHTLHSTNSNSVK